MSVMSQSNPADTFCRPKTSYTSLYCYQKAEAIYDLTYYFLRGHIDKRDRTYDQMLQAARSGKQNIVEGRTDAAASAEMEIKLYQVAIGSLAELLNDYLDYMRTRNLEIWSMEHPRFGRLREACREHNDTAYFMAIAPRLDDCALCNMIVTLIYQCKSMLGKLFELVKADFVRNGGIKEQMFRARTAYRNSH